MIFGIDLGTTNSLIGLIEGGRPRLFTDEGSTLIPSVVSFLSSGEPMVGSQAKRRKVTDSTSTLYSAKRFIGKGLSDVSEWMKILPFDFSKSDEKLIRFSVGGKVFSSVDVSQIILSKLKSVAERELGKKVERAVVTVPAYFNDAQRQATKLAGQLAGLEVVRILNEPTAACLAYGLDKKNMGNIVVFDMGGGTFDISILKVKDGVFEVLATKGDTALGGDDFDQAMVKNLWEECEKYFGVRLADTADLRAALLVEVERAKCVLSTAPEVNLCVNWGGKEFNRSIRLDEFETWISDVLKRLEDPSLTCLKDAGLSNIEVSDVILVGGCTRVPRVKKLVQSLFGREPVSTINPDEVVAIGASVQAHVLAGKMDGILLLDVIPLSLGIETMGGIVSRIIHRNMTIPVGASETFTTYADGQTSVSIHVLQGERELVKDSRSLAQFELKGLPPMPAGLPKIEVEFIVDANGILSVKAIELRTKTVASIVVNPSYGLTDVQVERMLTEAFDHAEEDFEMRFLIEAKTEAETILRATRKSLAKGSVLISKAEIEKIETAIEALERELPQGKLKEIRREMERLNNVTRNLAEKLLNHAVSEALVGKNTGD